jgi:hypothetical protein
MDRHYRRVRECANPAYTGNSRELVLEVDSDIVGQENLISGSFRQSYREHQQGDADRLESCEAISNRDYHRDDLAIDKELGHRASLDQGKGRAMFAGATAMPSRSPATAAQLLVRLDLHPVGDFLLTFSNNALAGLKASVDDPEGIDLRPKLDRAERHSIVRADDCYLELSLDLDDRALRNQ